MTNLIEIINVLNKQGYPVDVRIDENNRPLLMVTDGLNVNEEHDLEEMGLANAVVLIAEIITPYIA